MAVSYRRLCIAHETKDNLKLPFIWKNREYKKYSPVMNSGFTLTGSEQCRGAQEA